MAWTTPGTATAGEVLTAAFWNENVRDNSNELAPFFGAWTSYTPTLGVWTLGSSTLTGSYLKVGRFCAVEIDLTLNGATTTAGNPTFTLPFAAETGLYSCNASLNDAGVGNYFGAMVINTAAAGGGICFPQALLASATYLSQSGVSNTVPFTWGNGDQIRTQGPLIYQTTT
jgi:hypothetical protein